MLKHHTALAAILVLIGGYLLYIHQMPARGLVGPDEPRYASIAREMAESGDWVTPRLHGEPWFEKPALLYWLGASAAKLGIEGDAAIRLPVALLSIAFLCFFYWQQRREFGPRPAAYATLILATSAGWVAYSQVGVFDIPLAVLTSSALLVLLPWIAEPSSGHRGRMAVFGALLGAAFLAKGLVGPAVAFLALLSVCRDRGPLAVARELFHPRALIPFAIVGLPWYVMCYWRDGPAFLDEFFWRHHVDRIASESIQHVEPFWYYIPVLVAALLPWTPLLAAIPKADFRGDARLRFLVVWSVSAFVMFSLVTNKLPGYLLPVLPPLAALIGIRLAANPFPRAALIAAAAAWVMLPLAERVLPGAIEHGLQSAWGNAAIPPVWWLLPPLAAGVTWQLVRRSRSAAIAFIGAASFCGWVYLESATFPAIDRQAGTRRLWNEIEPHLSNACIGDVRRHVEYGLQYYSAGELPLCENAHRPFRIESDPAVFRVPSMAIVP